jgi:hypothetical protein
VQTIEAKKSSQWSANQAWFPYILFGLNIAFGAIPRYWDTIDIFVILIIIVGGCFLGALYRLLQVNIIYFCGKIWHGKASTNEIDNVVALSLIPEILISIHLAGRFIIYGGEGTGVATDPLLEFVCFLISMRILLIGLAKVQKFSYGLALLNVVLPALMGSILVYLLRSS